MLRFLLSVLITVWAGSAMAADKPLYGPAPDWVAPIEVPKPQEDTGGGLQSLLKDVQIKVTDAGTVSYVRSVSDVRTSQGLRAAGNLALPWSPRSDTLTIHHVHILRGGEVIDALAGGRTFTVVRREENLELAILDGILTATFQPSGLRVGDRLDFAFTLDRSASAYLGHAEQFTVNMLDTPTQRLRLRAIWPKDKPVRWRVAEGLPKPKMTTLKGQTELLIDMTDVQTLKTPDSAPGRFSEVGYMEVSDHQGWKDISTLLAPHYNAAMQLPADSPLRAEIAKIRAASNDPKVQAAAALRLVQDDVRYVYLSLDGDYLPVAAHETWVRRFGDCKGKSVLLAAILRELGIEAEPALVSVTRNSGLNARLPLMQAFDHVIVRAVLGGKVYWMDGARTGDRLLDAQAPGAYRWALPIRVAGADLERLPAPVLLKPTEDIDLQLDARGGLDAPAPVTARATFWGDGATTLKLAYDELSGPDRAAFVRAYWENGYKWIKVKDTAFRYDDATGEAHVTMTGEADMDWEGRVAAVRRYEVDGGWVGWKTKYEREPGPHADAPFAISPTYERNSETILLPNEGEGFSIAGANVDRTVGAWRITRKASLNKGVFSMETSTISVADEMPYAEAQAAVGPLAELYKDGLYVVAPSFYRATEAELKAMADEAPTAESLVEQGALHLTRGDLDEAVKVLTEAVKLDPQSALAVANRGVAYFWKGDLAAAQADSDKAIALNPREAVPYNLRGLLAARKGEHQKAIEAFTRSDELGAGSAFPLIQRSRSRQALGDNDGALADLEAALKYDPAGTNIYEARVRILLGQGKREEAKAEADKFIALQAADADGHLARGNMFLITGRKAEAREAFDASLALEKAAPAYIGRSQTYAAADRPKAFADLEEARRLDPEMSESRVLLASFRLADGDAAGALRDIDAFLADQPNHHGAQSLRGSALLRLGRYDEALAEVNKRLETEPGDPSLLNQRCWIRATSRQALESGLADCDASLKARPQSAAVLDSRGLIKLQMGRLDDAIADYDAALKLSPRMPSSLYGRGIARKRKGLKAEGEADLAAAKAEYPKMDELYASYGVTP
jgi:tetratricopeptide (TPR) repeat protein